jgi:hypothetical protein
MMTSPRGDWSRHIDQILRSKHYTWIAEGLGGCPVDAALVSITTDLMHMCQRSGLSWEQIVAESERLCTDEETSRRARPTHAA